MGHLFVGNENDRGQVTGFVNLLYQLCRELGVTVVLIAHPNKAGDSYSGSTAWLNAVRSQIVLQRPEGNPDPAPDARLLTLGKANYARPDQQIEFFWKDFALVLDSERTDEERSETAANQKAAAENAAFLKCLAAATANRRAVSHNPGVNYYGSVFPKMTEGNQLNRAAYERAFERLLHLGLIELDAALWQDAHRHWKRGIKAVEKCAPPAAPPAATCGTPLDKSLKTLCGLRMRRPPLILRIGRAGPLAAPRPPMTRMQTTARAPIAAA